MQGLKQQTSLRVLDLNVDSENASISDDAMEFRLQGVVDLLAENPRIEDVIFDLCTYDGMQYDREVLPTLQRNYCANRVQPVCIL